MPERVDLTIVIVNYRVRELVRRLLASVFTHTQGVSFEVVFVDNASGDGSVGMVAKEFPQAQIIANNQNLGFAKANNQAIRLARGKHVLLLNPDTGLIENAPAVLFRFAEEHPNAGVVGCRILNPDRTLQKSVLAFPTLCSQALIMLKLHHLFPWIPCLRRYFQKDFDCAKSQMVDQVMGSAFLMTRSALERVGAFDERYFLWFEEVDYCKMARDHGLEVWYDAETSVIHHGGQSFAQLLSLRKQRYFNDSLAKYMRKQMGLGAWIVVRMLSPLSYALAWLVGILKIRRKKYA
jgi:hypothetical protein